MGKRIIQQRRGRGTNTYKVRKKAFRFIFSRVVEETREKLTHSEMLGEYYNKKYKITPISYRGRVITNSN